MATQQAYTLTLVTGGTEVLIATANVRLIKILPMGPSLGSVTLREASAINSGSNIRWIVPILTPAVGVDFDANGVAFAGGLTVLLSAPGDVWGIVWGPRL
jgi:hypothetical protein